MAELIGLAASLAGIIQLTVQVTKLGYSYLGAVKGSSDNVRGLLVELSSLCGVLVTLKDYADRNPGSSELKSLNEPNGPIQECLRELRSELEKLQKILAEITERGIKGVINRLKWPLNESETSQIIATFERHKTLVTLALATDHIQMSGRIEEQVQSTHLAVQQLQTETAAAKIQEKRNMVLDWLSSDKFDTRHIEISSKRQKNTGDWLLETPEVNEWVKKQQDSHQRLLWGYGIPGAGKTFLSSRIIDHIQALQKQSTTNYGLAFIYFNYQEQLQQKPIHVLSSLVKQLISQIPHIPTEVEDLYERLESQKKSPTPEDLHSALLVTFKLFDQVFFVFDALDECNQEEQREELLPLFHDIAENGANVFLTSRPYPEDIHESLHESPKVELSANDQDIKTYILERINSKPRAKKLVEKCKYQDKIVSELIHCAQGMFLLVRFHVEYLCQQINPRGFMSALDKLKNSVAGNLLDDTYDRAVAIIIHGQPENKDLALRILSWLTKARRPLTVDELLTAVSLESERYELDEMDLPDKATLLDVCGSLVMIDENSNIIRLVHYTVQEYLLRRCVIPEEADFQLAMACTTFLSFDILVEGACQTSEKLQIRMDSNPFLDYAASHFGFHLKNCSEDLTTDMVLRFFENPGSISSYLQALHAKGDPPLYNRYPQQHLPLHVASALGHCAVARQLLDEVENVSIPDSNNDTAIHLAARRGHDMVVSLLIDNGAEISADGCQAGVLHGAAAAGHDSTIQLLLERCDVCDLDNSGQSALHYAAYEGHESTVKLLLDKDADISIQDINGWTALHYAALSTVQLLLDRGADISIKDDRGRTVMHQAASFGHESVIRILIKNRADLSARDNDEQTPLHKAAANGQKSAAKLLLESGVDISSQDVNGETPLHSATLYKQESTVKILLEMGANTSAQDKDGRTALYYAARRGWDSIIRLLVDRGAEFSIKDNNGITALYCAAQGGFESTVRLLLTLDGGTDLSVTDDKGRTPLLWAAMKGYEPIVGLLLDGGADISAQDKFKHTALHEAVRQGHESIVKLLLAKGAKSGTQGHLGRTALHLAVISKSQSMIQLLLDIDADPSITDDRGQTVLHEAAVDGHESTIAILLEKGANPSAQDQEGRTPLSRAAPFGRDLVVSLLLGKGADPSIQDNDGQTALHLAAQEGYDVTVELLLDKGADPLVRNSDGQTVLDAAAECLQQGIVDLIHARFPDTKVAPESGSSES